MSDSMIWRPPLFKTFNGYFEPMIIMCRSMTCKVKTIIKRFWLLGIIQPKETSIAVDRLFLPVASAHAIEPNKDFRKRALPALACVQTPAPYIRAHAVLLLRAHSLFSNTQSRPPKKKKAYRRVIEVKRVRWHQRDHNGHFWRTMTINWNCAKRK